MIYHRDMVADFFFSKKKNHGSTYRSRSATYSLVGFGGILLFLFGLFFLQACTAKELRPAALRLSAAPFFPHLPDTAALGVRSFSVDADSPWWVVYNQYPDTPQILFFRAPHYRPAHRIRLEGLPPCTVSDLRFVDPRGDGDWLLWLELFFDYGSTYRKRAVRLYRYPFRKRGHREVLEAVTLESWCRTDGFDSLDNPIIRRNTPFDATLIGYADGFRLEGTIDGKNDRVLWYAWDTLANRYLPFEQATTPVAKVSDQSAGGWFQGRKKLRKGEGLSPLCTSWMLVDESDRPIYLPELVQSSLRCSQVASLSPDGRYLVFEDSAAMNLSIFDFEKNQKTTLYRYAKTLEGISDFHWSPSGLHFVTVVINHEELPDDTAILYFTVRPAGGFSLEKKEVGIPFDCLGLRCTAAQEDYAFDSENTILYRSRKKGGFLKIAF
jgi:hypothetical protein